MEAYLLMNKFPIMTFESIKTTTLKCYYEMLLCSLIKCNKLNNVKRNYIIIISFMKVLNMRMLN